MQSARMARISITAADARRVAVVAQVDPRTVAKVVNGTAPESVTRTRIVEALRSLGFGDPPAPKKAKKRGKAVRK